MVSADISAQGGGGGTASLRVGNQNKTTDPRLCATIALCHCSYWFTAPWFSRYQWTACCYYCCYCSCPSTGRIFSYPNTISLITQNTNWLIHNAFLGPDKAQNYCPHRVSLLSQPPSESPWVSDSPPFSSLVHVHSHSSRGPFGSGYPKKQVSAPPPPSASRLSILPDRDPIGAVCHRRSPILLLSRPQARKSNRGELLVLSFVQGQACQHFARFCSPKNVCFAYIAGAYLERGGDRHTQLKE